MEIVQKIVNVEVRASLRSSIMVRDSDAHYSRRHRLSYNTFSKMQTQSSNYKDLPCSKESKSKDPKSAPPCNNMAEPAKKEGKKKKKSQRHRRECTGKWKEQLSVTGVITKVPKKKKKRRDPSEIIYFNYDKEGHYANNCTKPKN